MAQKSQQEQYYEQINKERKEEAARVQQRVRDYEREKAAKIRDANRNSNGNGGGGGSGN